MTLSLKTSLWRSLYLQRLLPERLRKSTLVGPRSQRPPQGRSLHYEALALLLLLCFDSLYSAVSCWIRRLAARKEIEFTFSGSGLSRCWHNLWMLASCCSVALPSAVSA